MGEAGASDPKADDQLTRLSSVQREAELKPATLLQWAELQPGTHVVDLGAGAGFYAVPAAQLGAQVVAVDPDRSLLYALELRSRRLGLPIKTVVGKAEEWAETAPERRFDLALLSFVIHEQPLSDRALRLRLLNGIKRILKPDGKLLVVEFRRKAELTMHGLPEPAGWVPGPEDERRVGPLDLAELARPAGFSIKQILDLPPICYAALLETGERHS